MLNNKGQNSIIKWYEYQMVDSKEQVEDNLENDLEELTDNKDYSEYGDADIAENAQVGGKFEGLEGHGDMLDERVAQIMQQYTGAKQNNVDDIIHQMNQ